jgi:hypothetical protein
MRKVMLEEIGLLLLRQCHAPIPCLGRPVGRGWAAWYVLSTAALRLPPGIDGKVNDFFVELNRIELSAS